MSGQQREEKDQTAIVAFLMRPDAYPHRPASVERLDTHGAMIFLAGERAYKLKRAVKLAYLDFSTLSRRKAVCERELALNSVTAPALYKGLVPVTSDGAGGLQLGGSGEPVEWLIEMARFSQDQLFDQLATAGGLDDGLIDALAEVIARFHAAAPVADDAPWPQSLGGVIGTIEAMLTRWAVRSPDHPAGYGEALRAEFLKRAQLMTLRRDIGYVRRCHSDLHLKNIVLVDGAPCLFDALEFDEDLGRIDVLYDLAFLIMDLWRRGLARQANRLFNAYFSRNVDAPEWAGLALLPLFLSIRAAVRAMVGLDALELAETDTSANMMREISDYLALGVSLLLPGPPRLIALGGLSGTGKTTVARDIAAEIGAAPGAIVLRSDVERKVMLGKQATDRLHAAAYSHQLRGEVYTRLLAKAKLILAAGHCVILDAVFDEPQHRRAVSDLAVALGVPFAGIWLEAPEAVLVARVNARKGDASDADAGVLAGQIGRVAAPHNWAKAAAGGSTAETAENIRRLLKI